MGRLLSLAIRDVLHRYIMKSLGQLGMCYHLGTLIGMTPDCDSYQYRSILISENHV